MKSFKYVFSIFLLLGASFANAQSYGCSYLTIPTYPTFTICGYYNTSGTIPTPNGSTVSVLQLVGGDLISSSYKDDMKNAALNYYGNRISFEAEATAKYNCHSYAWANTNVWINPPNQAEYWIDTTVMSTTK
jgi:hypothetical protein